MTRIELIGGAADGLEGVVELPQEVVLVRGADGFVDAYEITEVKPGGVKYRWARCVGKLGTAADLKPQDAGRNAGREGGAGS